MMTFVERGIVIKEMMTVAVVALALSACGNGPKEGLVMDTWHEPSHPYLTTVCASYRTNGTCAVSIPMTEYTEEEWRILLKPAKGKQGWKDVSERTYLRCRSGMHFPECNRKFLPGALRSISE